MFSEAILIIVPCVILVFAISSPLLTFANLWQIKSWRWDRLWEHIQAEGWLLQLFGRVRPPLLLAGFLLTFTNLYSLHDYGIGIAILGICLLNVAQFSLKRQPKPIWTTKTLLLVGGTIALNILLYAIGIYVMLISVECIFAIKQDTSLLVNTPIGPLPCSFIDPLANSLFWLLYFLPVLQPFLFGVTWLAFQPIDTYKKGKIMQRATLLRSQLKDMTVVGITGSVGKTTVKELLAHILSDTNALVTPAHVNADVGVANWFLANVDKASLPDTLVVEMGAYRIGEIAELCSMLQPSITAITYIGDQHIGLFGSQEAVIQAKGEIAEAVDEHGYVLYNIDSKNCSGIPSRTKATVLSAGTDNADIQAKDIEETSNGIRFSLDGERIETSIQGTHNVSNILIAIGIAKQLEVDMSTIKKKLATFTIPDKTFVVKKEGSITLVDDTHNASSTSFLAAIRWTKSQPATQKVLLTSGLIELGKAHDTIHQELGAQSKGVFDRVIFTNQKSAKAFEKGFGSAVETYSKESSPVESGSLLMCEGRVSEKIMKKLIP